MLALEQKKSSGGRTGGPLVQRHAAPAPVTQPERIPAPPHSCACGGSCPRCQARSSLAIGVVGAQRPAGAAPVHVFRQPRSATSPKPMAPHGRPSSGTVAPGHADAAAGVASVLRAPGQSLDTATRARMEAGFGHDFGHVRVHTDRHAAESARAVSAHAYTVGRNIVFDAGQFAPGTAHGARLLAHELTHVVQQAGAGPTPGNIMLGRAGDQAEHEADRVTAQLMPAPASAVLGAGAVRDIVSRDAHPVLRRWKIDGNTATSDSDTDTLGGLAKKAGAHFNDWKCIRPVSMRAATLPAPPANFNARYELYINTGDQFDISNLTATTGSTLSIHLFDATAEPNHANLAALFYPGSVSSTEPDVDLELTSNGGASPIADMVIFGHAGGGSMWGGAGNFAPAGFNPEEPPPTYPLANAGLFPRRCWFTRNAAVRSVGCDSQAWGTDFASHYLRTDANVTTTTKSVRPKCSAPLFVNGTCQSFDGLDFASSSQIGAPMLDGPFWTVAEFHAGKFWTTIKGAL
ncbi:DUF4157 domain-containing protein [Pseudoduganella sp. SL102]|uniref:eCIS core domain-containing protein n=1 Tax=Pseudoduganella sp. SL102 TaxID=2995154 RepID=UPI00248CDF7B|nr:DUF4157 domain-containing protein [Pseudoduganella sp. SL102]WBS03070.1 DUF4157 domain-containing protein [Pseudoduganella sp. SL102]